LTAAESAQRHDARPCTCSSAQSCRCADTQTTEHTNGRAGACLSFVSSVHSVSYLRVTQDFVDNAQRLQDVSSSCTLRLRANGLVQSCARKARRSGPPLGENAGRIGRSEGHRIGTMSKGKLSTRRKSHADVIARQVHSMTASALCVPINGGTVVYRARHNVQALSFPQDVLHRYFPDTATRNLLKVSATTLAPMRLSTSRHRPVCCQVVQCSPKITPATST
jgi:hypothetical protein